jgi:hypothetical protein
VKEMLFQLPADARNLIWYYTKMDHVRMIYKGVNLEFRDWRHTYLMILIAQKLKCTSGVYLHQNFMACTNKLFQKYSKKNMVSNHAYSQFDTPDFGTRSWLNLYVARECARIIGVCEPTTMYRLGCDDEELNQLTKKNKIGWIDGEPFRRCKRVNCSLLAHAEGRCSAHYTDLIRKRGMSPP